MVLNEIYIDLHRRWWFDIGFSNCHCQRLATNFRHCFVIWLTNHGVSWIPTFFFHILILLVRPLSTCYRWTQPPAGYTEASPPAVPKRCPPARCSPLRFGSWVSWRHCFVGASQLGGWHVIHCCPVVFLVWIGWLYRFVRFFTKLVFFLFSLGGCPLSSLRCFLFKECVNISLWTASWEDVGTLGILDHRKPKGQLFRMEFPTSPTWLVRWWAASVDMPWAKWAMSRRHQAARFMSEISRRFLRRWDLWPEKCPSTTST